MEKFLAVLHHRGLKKLLRISGAFVLCLLPTMVFAQSTGTTGQSEQDILQKMLQSTVLLMQIFYALLLPAISLIGSLLSNDWVMGSSTGFDQTLESVWVFIRNLVNMVFVVVLLIMAFMYIIKAQSGDGGDYGIKSMLPNIIIAVVAVNFSLLGCRVILDASSILTSGVFSIPNTVTSLDYPFRDMEKFAFVQYDNKDNVVGCMYHHYYFNIDQAFDGKLGTGKDAAAKTDTTTGAPPSGKNSPLLLPMKPSGETPEDLKSKKVFYIMAKNASGKDTPYVQATPIATLYKQAKTPEEKRKVLTENCITDMDTLMFNERTAMYAFAYGLLNIPSYEAVLSKDIKIDRFLLSTMLGILMLFIIVGVIYALLIALLVRTIVLWGLIAASPLWVLELVFKGGGPFKGITEKISLTKFVELAFMPVAVGAVLSFSFILLLAIKTTLPELGVGKYQLGIGGMSILFGENPITAGAASIQDFIFTLIVLAVLWVAVFRAIKMGDITDIVSKSIGSIEGLGKSAAELAGSGLSSIPMVPTLQGFASPKAVTEGLKTMKDGLQDKLDDNARDQANKVFGDLPFYTMQNTKEDSQAIRTARNIEKPTIKNLVELSTKVSNINNREVSDTMGSMLKRMEEQSPEMKAYIATGEGKKFADIIKSGGRLTREELRRFVDNAPAGTLGANVTRKELLAMLDEVRDTGGTTTPTSQAPLSSFVKIENNSVMVDGNKLTNVTREDWNALAKPLEKVQRADGALLTPQFINGFATGGRIRAPRDAAQALRTSKAILPTGDELQKLANAIFGEGTDANTFVTEYTRTTP